MESYTPVQPNIPNLIDLFENSGFVAGLRKWIKENVALNPVAASAQYAQASAQVVYTQNQLVSINGDPINLNLHGISIMGQEFKQAPWNKPINDFLARFKGSEQFKAAEKEREYVALVAKVDRTELGVSRLQDSWFKGRSELTEKLSKKLPKATAQELYMTKEAARVDLLKKADLVRVVELETRLKLAAEAIQHRVGAAGSPATGDHEDLARTRQDVDHLRTAVRELAEAFD
ncbi:hypothetical protein GCM10009665_09610 [Kitasatospora nipponensis]|uniref:Uncharacterized protein n=1 Tax=Kitasatospora nipponensis TaxID=258049 RepID=A0ABN1VSA2_9ACTN